MAASICQLALAAEKATAGGKAGVAPPRPRAFPWRQGRAFLPVSANPVWLEGEVIILLANKVTVTLLANSIGDRGMGWWQTLVMLTAKRSQVSAQALLEAS